MFKKVQEGSKRFKKVQSFYEGSEMFKKLQECTQFLKSQEGSRRLNGSKWFKKVREGLRRFKSVQNFFNKLHEGLKNRNKGHNKWLKLGHCPNLRYIPPPPGVLSSRGGGTSSTNDSLNKGGWDIRPFPCGLVLTGVSGEKKTSKP